MRNDMLRKGLVIGIIMLFFGAGVLPSISGKNSPKTLGLTGDLIAYWKFDEGSGSVAHDSSGNGYDGNIYGAT